MLEFVLGAALLLVAFDVVNVGDERFDAIIADEPIHSMLVLLGAIMLLAPLWGWLLQKMIGNRDPIEAIAVRLGGFEDMRMPVEQQKIWRSARTVPGLARIGARYLRGEIASQPGYAPNTPVDPETHDLMPAIVAANEAGFWTTGSQSGNEGPNGEFAGARAWVTGYLDEDHYPLMVKVLKTACVGGADLRWRAERVSQPHVEHVEHGDTKRMECRPAGVTYFREHYGRGRLHIAAFSAVLASWEICIEDGSPGNDVMNQVLTDFAAECGVYKVGRPA